MEGEEIQTGYSVTITENGGAQAYLNVYGDSAKTILLGTVAHNSSTAFTITDTIYVRNVNSVGDAIMSVNTSTGITASVVSTYWEYSIAATTNGSATFNVQNIG